MPYPSKDAPWVIPEVLADELFEDVRYLLRVANERRNLLPRDDDPDDENAGIYLSAELFGLLRMAVIMTTAAMEAMANEELLARNLYQEHAWDRLEDKWVFLYAEADIRPKKGSRPWQSLPRLVSLRNRLVHHVPTEIVLAEQPKGSLKMELLGSDGQLVQRLADDAIEIAAGYMDVKDPDEALRLRAHKLEDHSTMMRTLPWMDLEEAKSLPPFEQVDLVDEDDL